MKVYLLVQFGWDHYEVLGVYKASKLAYDALHVAQIKIPGYNYDVEEWNVTEE